MRVRRTRRLALEVIWLVEELPKSVAGMVIGRQLMRCGTSVGANYRAACRGKSTPDMLQGERILRKGGKGA